MQTRFTLPQLVIFDWDNTLIENWGALLEAMNTTLAAFNKPAWNRAQMIENSRQSLRNSFPVIFGEEWEKAREIFYGHFNKHHVAGLKKLDGAEALLDFLAEHGVRMAVCSNKVGLALRREVKHLNWRRYFNGIVGAQDAEKDKPDCAPVRMILRHNGFEDFSRDEIWFVGDTVSDMQCAWRAGLLPVGLGEGARENSGFMPKLWAANPVELLTEFKRGLSSVASLPRVVTN